MFFNFCIWSEIEIGLIKTMVFLLEIAINVIFYELPHLFCTQMYVPDSPLDLFKKKLFLYFNAVAALFPKPEMKKKKF